MIKNTYLFPFITPFIDLLPHIGWKPTFKLYLFTPLNMTLTLTLLHWWRPQPFFLLFYMSMRVWQLGIARSYYHWMLVCLKWQQEKLYHDQRTSKQKTSLSIFNLKWHRLPKLDQTLAYLTLLSVCSVNWQINNTLLYRAPVCQSCTLLQ